MSLSKTLLIVLLLLNTLALAAGLGLFGKTPLPKGETQRPEAQISPELLIIGDKPPPADTDTDAVDKGAGTENPQEEITAVDTAVQLPETPAGSRNVCIVYQNISAEETEKIRRAAAQTGPGMNVRTSEIPPTWWVHTTTHSSQQTAQDKIKTLRGQGVEDLFIVREAGEYQFAISLGVFKSANSAHQMLETLKKKGVTDVTVSQRNEPGFKVELRGPEERLKQFISTAGSDFPPDSGRCR